MSKYSFQAESLALTAVADGGNATVFAALENASATSMHIVSEITQTGLASTSTVNINQLSRAASQCATPTTLAVPNSNGLLNGWGQGTACNAYVAATTSPTRSAVSFARLNLSFNSWGGVFKWNPPPGFEWQSLGTANNTCGTYLSAFTGSGSGAQGVHMLYEAV